MDTDLDIAVLCTSNAKQIAKLFLRLAKKYPEAEISAHLLSALAQEAVPPRIFSIWLSLCRNLESIVDALKQEHSVRGRMAAIKNFGKLLKTSQWERVWQGLGGTNGLLALFAQLSTLEVGYLAITIGSCSKNHDDRRQQETVTELLHGLLPALYPGSPHQSSDGRPLYGYYARLVPACTLEVVREVMCDKSNPLRPYLRYLDFLPRHYELLRQLTVDKIFERTDTYFDYSIYLPSLLTTYPQIKGIVEGCSESMVFSLTLLRKLCTDPHADFPQEIFADNLVKPLLQRAMKKRIDPTLIKEIIHLTVAYLHSHPEVAAFVSSRENGFLYLVAQCWSRNQDLFEGYLVSTIRVLKDLKNEPWQTSGYSMHRCNLAAFPRSLRYRLLRLLFLHEMTWNVDIDKENDIKNLRFKKWPCELFTNLLQPDQALALFLRLLRVNPDGDFLDRGQGILSISLRPDGASCDHNLLLAVLEQGELGAIDRAAKIVDDRKKNANTSREQTNRAHYATSALFSAIASGSLELYYETVIWARRFIRDSSTLKRINGRKVTNTVQGIELLSGIPRSLSHTNGPEVRSRVAKANEILLAFLDTAISALREPSFYAPDWDGPLTLFREVVRARLDSAKRLQRALNLLDDELYDVLWSDTVKMLLEAERKGLQPENKSLKFNAPKGPLFHPYAGIYQVKPRLSTSYLFSDNLARMRNNLWEEHRSSLFTDAAALQHPWPRGLPIQCLIPPFDICTHDAYGYTPYLASRAEEVVFIKPELAFTPVPQVEETVVAIGPFIDWFPVALKIYVLQSSPQEEDQRTQAAWTYATKALSQSRMTFQEAIKAWKPLFSTALPRFKAKDWPENPVVIGYPQLPVCEDPDEQTEWDPTTTDLPHSVKPRELDPTYLDCSTLARDFGRMMPKFRTPGFNPPDVFDLCRCSQWTGSILSMPAEVQEGLVVAAMLVLDSQKGGRFRILISSFPSKENCRYPAIFLDSDFLLNHISRQEPVRILKRLLNNVPSTLLAALASAAIDEMESKDISSYMKQAVEGIGLDLLRLLKSSDRPEVASKLILRTIMSHPDQSSWHRQLLTPKFLWRLSATDAHDLLIAFAAAVREKLIEQSANIDPSKEQERHQKAFVKVTTVKFLAQLLNNANFVSPNTSIKILLDLFHAGTHIDIRVAVVDSLLGMLRSSDRQFTTGYVDRLLLGLEAVIPLVSGLSERSELQEQDWVEAERMLVVPQIGEVAVFSSLPPIMELLATAASETSLPQDLRLRIVQQILLPIVHQSCAVNLRWLRIFIEKHTLSLHRDNLISGPLRYHLLSHLLKSCIEMIPDYILRIYHDFITTNMSPPASIETVNHKIRGDVALKTSNDGKHWLSQYGLGLSAFNHGNFSLASMLCEAWKNTIVPEGITVPKIQMIIVEQAEILIQNPEISFKYWNEFLKVFQPPYHAHSREDDQKAWISNARPVLEAIAARIESIRTPEWQKNPLRRPSMLPSTFGLRLWFLSYPSLPFLGSVADRCKAFAGELASTITQLVERGTTYHEEFEKLTNAALQTSINQRAWTAVHIGIQASSPKIEGTAVLLCIDLSAALLRSISTEPDKEPVEAIKGLLASWMANEVESIRMEGLSVESKLKNSWMK